VVLVEEVAREYLADRGEYGAEDLLAIARLQVEAEQRALESGTQLVICDTDLSVIQVWWGEKFGPLPLELKKLLESRRERAYLLLKPDLAWVEDPLRENPLDRDRLFEVYQDFLDQDSFPHAVVSGTGDARLTSALAGLQRLLPEVPSS
jgi:nicotinamide riboside kinase